MEQLGNYILEKPLTNENAGYCLWGFGTKLGREYFIKQFVEMKYPVNDSVSSPERLEKKRKECFRFEQRKVRLYRAINAHSDGNAVRVEDFFRVESKYYIAMPRIHALPLKQEDIVRLNLVQTRRLCAIIAHCVASLHEGSIIHADLKPDNILIAAAPSGRVTAKLIDFDSSFLESEAPGPGEDIVGDFHYFSPEACLSIWGEEVPLTCKMDVFALGVLFHQYFTGELPGFNREESSYSGEAVAKGEVLEVSQELPEDIRELLCQMLSADPDQRPTAMEAFRILRGLPKVEAAAAKPAEPPVVKPASAPAFFRPGDL